MYDICKYIGVFIDSSFLLAITAAAFELDSAPPPDSQWQLAGMCSWPRSSTTSLYSMTNVGIVHASLFVLSY
eukprot:6189914-Pleurochrysis_carterae.AAC.1